jgi:hypothetical protein
MSHEHGSSSRPTADFPGALSALRAVNTAHVGGVRGGAAGIHRQTEGKERGKGGR